MCFFLLCPNTPPEKVSAKGVKGAAGNEFLKHQNNPNEFALGLKDACCKEPLACCISGLCAPCGFTACWARNKVLETYFNGMADFICCQGYVPGCCCVQPKECCPGSPVGLCLEGCCCPVLSISVARLHLMDAKQIRPDPCDWQIIACSNFLQLLSCIFHIIAIFVEELRDAADILDLIADCFTLSVAGCMGAQVYHETKNEVKGGQPQFNQHGGVPVAVGQPIGAGAPTVNEEMER